MCCPYQILDTLKRVFQFEDDVAVFENILRTVCHIPRCIHILEWNRIYQIQLRQSHALDNSGDRADISGLARFKEDNSDVGEVLRYFNRNSTEIPGRLNRFFLSGC